MNIQLPEGRYPQQEGRKRLLLLCYACSPYRGGEHAVGWQRAIGAARHFDTWVLVRQRNEADIRRWLAQHGEIEGLRFCFIPRNNFEESLKKIPWLYYFRYNLWQRSAYRAARQLQQKLRFDLIHHSTLCSYRDPGYLWKLDVPFIWGPVGGTQNYPWRFLATAGFGAAVKEGARSIANILQFRLSTRLSGAIRKSREILAANREAQRDFELVYHLASEVVVETGHPFVTETPRRHSRAHGPLRILWSGELIHRKALHLLLLALNQAPASMQYEVRVLGNGPLEKRWRRLAEKLGVASQVNFMGWLPFQEAMAQYDWADVFAFTSLRDTTGTVVLEALGAGVPVLCLDHQGAGDIVTAECGIKIPVTTPDKVVSDLRDAVVNLAQDRDYLAALSRGALDRAREFTWDRRTAEIIKVYRRILAEQGGNQWSYDKPIRAAEISVGISNSY